MKVKFKLKRELDTYSTTGAIRAAFEQNLGYILPRMIQAGVPSNRLFARFRYDVMDRMERGESLKKALNNVYEDIKPQEEKQAETLLNRIRKGSGIINGKKGPHYDLFKSLRKAAGWNEKIDPSYLEYVETDEHKKLRLKRKAEKQAGTYKKENWVEFEKDSNLATFVYKGPKGDFYFTIERRENQEGSLVTYSEFVGDVKL